MLLAGTAAGSIHLYDIASHQLLRTISNTALKGLAITHLETLLRPSDLIGHVSASLGASTGVGGVSARDVLPTRPIVAFQRIRDMKAREAHEVLVALQGNKYDDEVSFEYKVFYVIPIVLYRSVLSQNDVANHFTV